MQAPRPRRPATAPSPAGRGRVRGPARAWRQRTPRRLERGSGCAWEAARRITNSQYIIPGCGAAGKGERGGAMPIWEAVLLGVIQGLTEFLPISSTAHLLVARALLGHEHPEDAFTVVIQLGTLVAVFAYFRADVARLARGFWLDLRKRTVGATPDGRLAWLIILGTVPAVAVGFVLKNWLKRTFFNLPSIAVVSIVFALLMLAAEWWAHRRIARGQPARL